jgi:hypothetical protein
VFLLLFDRTPQTRFAAEAIANELELNATESARCEQGAQPADLLFHFEAWNTTKISARTLSHRDPDVWMEVVALYDHLRDITARGGWPPTAATMRELSTRLRRPSLAAEETRC